MEVRWGGAGDRVNGCSESKGRGAAPCGSSDYLWVLDGHRISGVSFIHLINQFFARSRA